MTIRALTLEEDGWRLQRDMGDPRYVADILLFPRAYYSEGYDAWTHPLNRGRLAEALLLHERVSLVTDGFTEVVALVEELGPEGLLSLIERQRLRFVLQPFFFAEISGPELDWDIGSGVLQHFGDVLNGVASLGDAIQHSLEKTPYDIPDLGPELLRAIQDSTWVVTPDVPGAAKAELATDLADEGRAASFERLLEQHLGAACPITDVFEVRVGGDAAGIHLRRLARDTAEQAKAKRATNGLLLLLEAELQLALSAAVGARFVSTNPLFEKILTAKSGEDGLVGLSGTPSVAGLKAATRILQLPDICLLVNADLIPLERAVGFADSQHGQSLRGFFAGIAGAQSDPEVEKAFLAAFAAALLPHGKMEELAASGGVGNVLFVLGAGVGFANPIAGIAFALLEKGARIAASRRWKPLLVLKRHLVGSVLARDVERERDRAVRYPSLSKLASQGYEVVIVRDFPDSDEALGEVVLAAQAGKMHWHVVLPRTDAGAQYLSDARNRLPGEDTMSGILLRRLAVGRLQRVDLAFHDEAEDTISFSIQRASTLERVEGTYQQFAKLLAALPYLLKPDKVNTTLHTRAL